MNELNQQIQTYMANELHQHIQTHLNELNK